MSTRMYRPTLFIFMEGLVGQLRDLGRTRTSENYLVCLNSYKHFRQNQDIALDEITADEMLRYEAWMTERGVCQNTSSFYMRILRAVYNRAVEHELTAQRHPFRHVYTGICKTRKRYIDLPEIRRLKVLDLEHRPALARARDLFLFSFYTRGMAFVDMAFLRRHDVHDGVIVYHRHKTGHVLHVRLERCMLELLQRYHNPGSDYLLPIIKRPGRDEYRQYRNALRRTNESLRAIGAMIGTPIRLTSYVGRHSWGNAARRCNVPLDVISESMGHTNERTTRIYLDALDDTVIDDANARILGRL